VFSATINSQIENLIKIGMRNPVYIDVKINNDDNILNIYASKEEIKNGAIGDNIKIIEDFTNHQEEIFSHDQEMPQQLLNQVIYVDNHKQKLPHLLEILNNNDYEKIIIFFATCNSVDYFSIVLPELIDPKLIDIKFYKLHSKITQKKRKKEYKKFLNSGKAILLTTDLSARGIDIPNVDLIIQFDPPKNEELYIHRAGRTARVGNIGTVIKI